MENSNNNFGEYGSKSDLFSMEITERLKYHLFDMAKWTKFLAIVQIVVMSLYVVGMLGLSTALSSLSSGRYGGYGGFGGLGAGVMIFVLLIMIGVGVYPVYALFKFSVVTKRALKSSDIEMFTEGIVYLKNFFKYIGVLLIIVLAFYGIIFLVGMMGALFR